jgi:Integrase core domain
MPRNITDVEIEARVEDRAGGFSPAWPTRRELQSAVFAWIEGWYNRRRLHSTLGYQSPEQFEENGTLFNHQGCASMLAASRLAHPHSMIKEKAA